ncbi:hypothetical protein BKA70DRAFT_1225408 [Coprinopsis sp. MPI-PUGE-AT-0042]|nr:hypothetical protein BKA70DRAFT_1225408 [Coprinopsis sp. MPI-PUGE-AT-0042]
MAFHSPTEGERSLSETLGRKGPEPGLQVLLLAGESGGVPQVVGRLIVVGDEQTVSLARMVRGDMVPPSSVDAKGDKTKHVAKPSLSQKEKEMSSSPCKAARGFLNFVTEQGGPWLDVPEYEIKQPEGPLTQLEALWGEVDGVGHPLKVDQVLSLSLAGFENKKFVYRGAHLDENEQLWLSVWPLLEKDELAMLPIHPRQAPLSSSVESSYVDRSRFPLETLAESWSLAPFSKKISTLPGYPASRLGTLIRWVIEANSWPEFFEPVFEWTTENSSNISPSIRLYPEDPFTRSRLMGSSSSWAMLSPLGGCIECGMPYSPARHLQVFCHQCKGWLHDMCCEKQWGARYPNPNGAHLCNSQLAEFPLLRGGCGEHEQPISGFAIPGFAPSWLKCQEWSKVDAALSADWKQELDKAYLYRLEKLPSNKYKCPKCKLVL